MLIKNTEAHPPSPHSVALTKKKRDMTMIVKMTEQWMTTMSDNRDKRSEEST